MYSISFLFGYFLILLVFLMLAVLFAKTKYAWLIYSIGTIIQLLSLIGKQKTYEMYGMGTVMGKLWLVYLALLIIAAFLIRIRRSRD